MSAVVALIALVAATIEAGSVGLGDPWVLAGFAVAAVAGAAFVVVERRAASPMLPPALFRSRTFSFATGIGLVANTCFYGLIFVLSLLFQREQGYSPLRTGLALVPTMVAITAANLGAGRFAAGLGPRRTVALGALIMAAGCAGLLVVGRSTPYGAMVAQIAALGFGGGLIIPVITSEMLGSVERSRSGVAAGTLNTMRQAGSAVGVALFGSLLAGGLARGAHVAFAISIALALGVAAVSPLLDE